MFILSVSVSSVSVTFNSQIYPPGDREGKLSLLMVTVPQWIHTRTNFRTDLRSSTLYKKLASFSFKKKKVNKVAWLKLGYYGAIEGKKKEIKKKCLVKNALQIGCSTKSNWPHFRKQWIFRMWCKSSIKRYIKNNFHGIISLASWASLWFNDDNLLIMTGTLFELKNSSVKYWEKYQYYYTLQRK